MTTATTREGQTKMMELLEGVQANGSTSTTPMGRRAIQTRRHAPQTGPKGMAIGHDWRVGADQLNVILYRRVGTKGGIKERWAVEGYYSTLGNALVGLERQGVRDTSLESIQVVLDKIAELERNILKKAAGAWQVHRTPHG